MLTFESVMTSPIEEDLNGLPVTSILRERFLKEYKESIESGAYDDRDLDRVKSNDQYLECFVRSFSENGDLNKPTEMINTVLKFRKDTKINDLKPESFPEEIADRNVLYWHGVDKENRKILHFRVARHQKGKLINEMKSYIAMFLEDHHRSNLGVRIVLIFDFTDAGIMNMDLDVVRYIISCLSTYFPGILAYILLFEMPWLLSSAWKVIRSWLTEEQKKKIILVKKGEIQTYIAAEQLEPHML